MWIGRIIDVSWGRAKVTRRTTSWKRTTAYSDEAGKHRETCVLIITAATTSFTWTTARTLIGSKRISNRFHFQATVQLTRIASNIRRCVYRSQLRLREFTAIWSAIVAKSIQASDICGILRRNGSRRSESPLELHSDLRLSTPFECTVLSLGVTPPRTRRASLKISNDCHAHAVEVPNDEITNRHKRINWESCEFLLTIRSNRAKKTTRSP